MTEVCINGHTRTEVNTRWYKRGRGDQLKRVCLDCKKLRNTGKPAAHVLQVERTNNLHEDIEDLLSFGATFDEIVQRSGFSSVKILRASLRRRSRFDLLEAFDAKQEIQPNADLSTRSINGNKYTRGSLSLRNRG